MRDLGVRDWGGLGRGLRIGEVWDGEDVSDWVRGGTAKDRE